ncbi:MAG: CapA family protein [Pseudomonadota bacterium]
MRAIQLLIICVLPIAAAAVLAAEPVVVVVDESGAVIESASVDVSLRSGVVQVQASAGGYYDAVHTFLASRFESDSNLRITLVERTADRRLLVFAGDAMLARRYFSPRAGEPVLVREDKVLEDGAALLKTIRPYIDLADYASVNVETQLADGTLKDKLPKSVAFYSPPEFAHVLRDAGFDYAALGNNHTWDYQREGLNPTLKALQSAGLDYSGAGFDEASARAPANVAINGTPFAFLSYVGWAGTFEPSQVADGNKGGAALGGSQQFREDLSAIPADVVSTVQYHSGIEYAARPAGSERLRLRQAIDFGADIALGHHPHVLQGFEIYRGRLIAYSLGNFLFDQYIYGTQMGMLLYVWMDGDHLHRAEVVPVDVNGYVPTPATGQFAYTVLNRLARLSRPFGTCLRDNGAHATIEPCPSDASSRSQLVDIGGIEPTLNPVHLSALGLRPTESVAVKSETHMYRIGVDMLRRGDFETVGLFGTYDRTWITDTGAEIVTGASQLLEVNVPAGDTVRTGMKVFDRVFTPSAATTLRGRIKTNADVNVRVVLQRRRPDEPFSEALERGSIRYVGGARLKAGGWRDFAIDFDQPRLSTRGVRLLIDIRDTSGDGALVELDDFAWIEWQTPWLLGSGAPTQAEFGTHVQFSPNP